MIETDVAEAECPDSRPSVQWGHVVFVLSSLAFILWFLADAWRASDAFENLMLIVPLTIISVATGFAILVAMLLKWLKGAGDDVLAPIDLRIPAFMLLVVAYVAGLIYTGFDLATFFFILSGLWLLGERNYTIAVIYSATLTALVVFGLREIISIPVPTLLFPR